VFVRLISNRRLLFLDHMLASLLVEEILSGHILCIIFLHFYELR